MAIADVVDVRGFVAVAVVCGGAVGVFFVLETVDIIVSVGFAVAVDVGMVLVDELIMAVFVRALLVVEFDFNF